MRVEMYRCAHLHGPTLPLSRKVYARARRHRTISDVETFHCISIIARVRQAPYFMRAGRCGHAFRRKEVYGVHTHARYDADAVESFNIAYGSVPSCAGVYFA
jgi:hypothetical protein